MIDSYYLEGLWMTALGDYLKEIVMPTYEEFDRDQTRRRGFLAALVLFHCVERAIQDRKTAGFHMKGDSIRKAWGDASTAFKITDVVAHRFKHTGIDRGVDEERPLQWHGRVGFRHILNQMTPSALRSTLIDAIKFVQAQDPPARQLPAPSPQQPPSQ
jgi:hypothetical protein